MFNNQPLAMRAADAHLMSDANVFDVWAQGLNPAASKFIGSRDVASRWQVTSDGIALVPISGVLLDRGYWLGDLGGVATSYEGLAEQFRRLANDRAIKAVVLDIDSVGGPVAGLWDLCAELGKLKMAKKVYAVAANRAISAAYAVGCMADQFYVSRSGTAGSIGVIAIHHSHARALEGAGIDTTIIASGEHKADGNPFTQLSDGARAEICKKVEDSYAQFVAHVASHRRISERAVRDLESRCFSGEEAVRAGLADGVKCVTEAVEHAGRVSNGHSKPSPQKPRTKQYETTFATGFGAGLKLAGAAHPGAGKDQIARPRQDSCEKIGKEISKHRGMSMHPEQLTTNPSAIYEARRAACSPARATGTKATELLSGSRAIYASRRASASGQIPGAPEVEGLSFSASIYTSRRQACASIQTARANSEPDDDVYQARRSMCGGRG